MRFMSPYELRTTALEMVSDLAQVSLKANDSDRKVAMTHMLIFVNLALSNDIDRAEKTMQEYRKKVIDFCTRVKEKSGT